MNKPQGTMRFNALKSMIECGLLKPVQVTLYSRIKPLPNRPTSHNVTYYFEDLNTYYIQDGNGYAMWGKQVWSLNPNDMYKEAE